MNFKRSLKIGFDWMLVSKSLLIEHYSNATFFYLFIDNKKRLKVNYKFNFL